MSEAEPVARGGADERGRVTEVTPADRERTAPMLPARRSERSRGFEVEVEGSGELGCGNIRGFREAALAATDARAMAPQRLVLVAPNGELRAWLAAWAEDAEQVRRTLTICRRFDGKAIRAVVTLLAFGYGVETELAVESVSARRGDEDSEEIVRSGVHLKADIEAALARFFAKHGGGEEGGRDGEGRQGGDFD
jgi:hypothetical protein